VKNIGLSHEDAESRNKYISVLTAIFQVNLGYMVFIEAKDDGGGGDNWSYKSCKAPVKSSASRNQHPVFYRPDALPVAQPTVSKH